MSAIGPGDWIECVDADPHYLAEGVSPLVLGALYSVRVVWPDGGLSLNEVEPPPEYINFHPARFRPIYRPDEKLIRDLLQPVEEFA